MTPVPSEFWAIPAKSRVTAQAAIRAVEASGARVTVKATRSALQGPCPQAHLAALVRWHKRGLLPADWSGDAGPSATGRPRGSTKAKAQAKAARGEVGETEGVGLLGELLRQLDQRIAEGVDTHEGRNEALTLLARAVANGLGDKSANAIRQTLSELRQSGKDQRDLPTETAERILVVSEQGTTLVDAFERIVSDERRAQVLELAVELLREDLEALPLVDPLGKL